MKEYPMDDKITAINKMAIKKLFRDRKSKETAFQLRRESNKVLTSIRKDKELSDMKN